MLQRQRYLHQPNRLPLRGFNLVEAAIVLGVVGLVIGGIWVAAAQVNRSMKVNELVALIGHVHQRAVELYPAGMRPAGGAAIPLPENLLRGMVPGSTKMNGSDIVGPFGELISILLTAEIIEFGIDFQAHNTGISETSYCMMVAPKIGAALKNSIERFIGIGNELDVSTPDTAAANCAYENAFILSIKL